MVVWLLSMAYSSSFWIAYGIMKQIFVLRINLWVHLWLEVTWFWSSQLTSYPWCCVGCCFLLHSLLLWCFSRLMSLLQVEDLLSADLMSCKRAWVFHVEKNRENENEGCRITQKWEIFIFFFVKSSRMRELKRFCCFLFCETILFVKRWGFGCIRTSKFEWFSLYYFLYSIFW